MREDRLNHLMLLAIHKEETEKLDIDYIGIVKDIIQQDIQIDHPGVYHTAFANKSDYLDNIHQTVQTYSPVLRGRSTNSLSRDQKYALACILNSTGLWSEHWARYLRAVALPYFISETVLPAPSSATERNM